MRLKGADGAPEHGAPEIVLDLRGLECADVATLDALARLQLSARRSGTCLRLIHVSPALKDLLRFTGFAEVFEGAEPEA